MFLCLVCLHLNLRAQPSVTDADGNTYSTLTIGSQVWMAGNLRTTRYRNGDPIRNVRDNKVWESLPTGAFCVYGHNVEHAETYGALYNWHAVVDKRGLAPEGWHIPTKAEWEVLFQFLSDNGYGYEGSGSDIAFSLAANQGWSRAWQRWGYRNEDKTEQPEWFFCAAWRNPESRRNICQQRGLRILVDRQ